MTTMEFLKGFINPACHKIEHNIAEFNVIRSNPNVVLVKATTFYQIYKHNVFGADGKRLSMREFYRICGQYFYYDKYVCDHGTEFYYYIIFNEDNEIYKLTKDIVLKRVQVNAPEKLKDLQHVVMAVTKEV
jgi:hypothetical protein